MNFEPCTCGRTGLKLFLDSGWWRVICECGETGRKSRSDERALNNWNTWIRRRKRILKMYQKNSRKSKT